MEIKLDTTLERDIDLLIMEEFIADPLFTQIFLDTVGISGPYTIERAIHSMRDADLGESDIVFILNNNGLRHALHIEDKVDALAMPNQYNRYNLRAEKDIAEGLYDTYSVLIVAPEKYLSTNKEAKKYEYKVSYEHLRNYFAIKSDLRSKYKLALIDQAIYEQKSGYQWEANPHVVQFCTAMDAFQRQYYPNLPIGTQAWWRSYKTLLPDATIVYKANKGFCDLQFSNCTPQDLYPRVNVHLSERMTIEKAGKSTSVRIRTQPIWFEHPFEDRIADVNLALAAISELYELSKALIAPETAQKATIT